MSTLIPPDVNASAPLDTVWFWVKRGLEGVKLEVSEATDGKLYTNRAAVRRFLSAVNDWMPPLPEIDKDEQSVRVARDLAALARGESRPTGELCADQSEDI